jgi:Aromatic-ring-opening dioxygenase LigAB, LigA subunit
MSLLGVHSFIFRLKSDPATQEAFEQRSAAVFEKFDLAPHEIAALLNGDVVTLYRLGVHPLLLAPYSRYAGVPRPKYKSALAPLKGLRRLRS